MSRNVDLNKPLSDEDREYLASRSRHHEIIVNDRMFGPGGSGPEPEYVAEEDVEVLDIDADIAEHVLSLEVDELRSELIMYNITPAGHKEDLKEALAIHLQLSRAEEQHEEAQEKAKAQRAAKRA